MSRKRRNHSPEFKSKVALAAIKGDQTLSELSRQYAINSNLIVKWKKQLIEQSSEVFASVISRCVGPIHPCRLERDIPVAHIPQKIIRRLPLTEITRCPSLKDLICCFADYLLSRRDRLAEI